MTKLLVSLAAGAMVSGVCSMALAQGAPPPPPPPGDFDEVNAMILIDVSGSMADAHTSTTTKMDRAIILAKQFVDEIEAGGSDGRYTGISDKEYALWAFDGSFGSGNGFVDRILDFPATAAQVYQALGYNASGTSPSGTPDAALTPNTTTPLAAAGCFAGTELVASLDATGGLEDAGYEWDKLDGLGDPVSIGRELYLATDGLENATPSGNECAGFTSDEDYEDYESGSWQYKLRNKLLTGNPSRENTLNSGLSVNVSLIFENFVEGLSGGGSEVSYSGGTPYTTAPTLSEALEFYGGLAQNTLHGSFETVTVDASGSVTARLPGDVDYSGCVGNADYSEMMQWYGQAVSPNHPHSYWADLDGDGYIDYLDYLILYENWGTGGTC